MGAVRVPLLLALAVALAGCFSGERREQAAEIEGARVAIGPGYAAGAPAQGIIRGPAEDGLPPSRELDSKLAAAPSRELVREAAVRANPDLKAALERWVGFLEKVPQRTSLPYPTFRYGYSSMFRMYTYEGMQEVPFPTKLLADGRTALAEARAMRAEYRERKNVLGEQADRAYAGLYLARRELAIIEENIALLDRFVEIARTKYAAGTATQPDVLRAEVERDTLRSDRAAYVAGVEVAASALNVLLDRRPEAPLGSLAALPEPETATAAPPFERALELRPELAAAAERAAAADSMLSRARQEWIPDFALGGAYVHGFAPNADEAELSGGITLPIWWGRIGAAIAEAEAGSRRARAELRSTRNRVLDEVQSASARVAAAAESYRILAANAVPRAEQNIKASEAAYVAGQIDFLALIDSQRMLLMKLLDRERALADYTARRAELERAVGGAGER